jgi:hypothetical protein
MYAALSYVYGKAMQSLCDARFDRFAPRQFDSMYAFGRSETGRVVQIDVPQAQNIPQRERSSLRVPLSTSPLAQNVLLQAKNNVVKAWLVGSPGPTVSLIKAIKRFEARLGSGFQ